MDTWITKTLDPPVFWTALSAVALLLSLILILRYTRATAEMARATVKMARAAESTSRAQIAQTEQLRRPVVRIGCADGTDFNFRTTIKNYSSFPAKARVLAKFVMDDRRLEFPADHPYAGRKTWVIEGVGADGPVLVGHLDIATVLKYNHLQPPDFSVLAANVEIETWVIAFDEDEARLGEDSKKNPPARWNWSTKARRWVPDILEE